MMAHDLFFVQHAVLLEFLLLIVAERCPVRMAVIGHVTGVYDTAGRRYQVVISYVAGLYDAVYYDRVSCCDDGRQTVVSRFGAFVCFPAAAAGRYVVVVAVVRDVVALNTVIVAVHVTVSTVDAVVVPCNARTFAVHLVVVAVDLAVRSFDGVVMPMNLYIILGEAHVVPTKHRLPVPFHFVCTYYSVTGARSVLSPQRG
jgi:hypothetical protein